MPKVVNSTPKKDGFRMPGEFEPHDGTWMMWPERPDNWRLGGKPAQETVVNVVTAMSKYEKVSVIVSSEQYENAKNRLPEEVRVVEMSYDDAWVRDCGATYVKNDKGEIRGIDWGFNAWGGMNGGTYFPWDKDQKVATKMMDIDRIAKYDATHFILEGGSIHVDGEGTLITTEEVLLNENRNPEMDRDEIEDNLKEYLSVEKIIWIPMGLANDETDGHVDNVCFFVKPGVVCVAATDDKNSENYNRVNEAYEILINSTDAKGRKLEVHKVYLPYQFNISQEISNGYDIVNTTEDRSAGVELGITYINCFIINGAVIVPQFDDPRDKDAVDKYKELFPDRDIVPINTKEFSLSGGNVHCMNQQQPKA